MAIADKSKYFIVNEDENDLQFTISFNGIVIDKVASYKHLGFLVDKDLDLTL